MWEVYYQNDFQEEFENEEEAIEYGFAGDHYWDHDEVDIIYVEKDVQN